MESRGFINFKNRRAEFYFCDFNARLDAISKKCCNFVGRYERFKC